MLLVAAEALDELLALREPAAPEGAAMMVVMGPLLPQPKVGAA